MNIYKRRLTNNSLLDHKIQTLKNNINYKSSNTSICYNIQKNILIGKSTLNKYANIKIATDIDNIDNATDTTINNHSSEISTKQICKMFSDQYKDVYLNENGQVYGYTASGEMDSIGYNTSTGHTNVTFDEFISDFGNNFLNDVYTELMDGIESQTNSTIDTFLSNHSDWGTAYNSVQPMSECGLTQDFSNPVFNYSNYIVCEHYGGETPNVTYASYYQDSYLFFRGGSSEDTLIGWSDSNKSIYTDTTKIHNLKICVNSSSDFVDYMLSLSNYKVALGLTKYNGINYDYFSGGTDKSFSKFTAIMETLELNKILKQYSSFCSDFDNYSSSDPKIYHHETSAYTDNYVKVTPLANYGYHETLAKMRTFNNKYSTPTSLDIENISKTWIKSKIPLNVAKNIENDIIPIYHRYNYDFKFKFVWYSSPYIFYATPNSGYTGFSINYSNNVYGSGIIRCFNNFNIGTRFTIPNHTSEFDHNCYRNNVYCKQNTFINLLLNNIDTKYRKLINNLKDLSFITNSSTVSSYISTKKPLSKFIKTNRDLSFTDDTFATASSTHCIRTYARTDNPTQYTYFSSAFLANDTISHIGSLAGYTWTYKYPDALVHTYSPTNGDSNVIQQANTNKSALDDGIRDYFINPIKTKLIERIDNNSYTTTKPSYSVNTLRKQFINHQSRSDNGAPEK